MRSNVGLIIYKPAGYDTFMPNYPILTNTINKISTGDLHQTDYSLALNALLRHIGQLETGIKETSKKFKNPIICFQVGFTQIVSLPFYILSWFGILKPNSPQKLIQNGLYKLIVGIIGLVSFASSLVTIFAGWESTLKMYHLIFH